MINAIEARRITELDNIDSFKSQYGSLQDAADKVLPMIEEGIRIMCKDGRQHLMVKRDEIMKLVGFTLWSKKEIMNKISKELKSYGFKTSIPASYCSIHVSW